MNDLAGQHEALPEGASDAFAHARRGYAKFLRRCEASDGAHRLTQEADASLYATCFWIFGLHLLGKEQDLLARREDLDRRIRVELAASRADHLSGGGLTGKPYRQLLAFSLSALSILGTLKADPLDTLVLEQLPKAVEPELRQLGCLDGKAQSGNQAMFIAIFLLHARIFLKRDCEDMLDEWVQCHLGAMNRFGFWGQVRGMTALQFQNGYHQYEILEYLQQGTGQETASAAAVAGMADREGHFAPYPGGGGCFDYDAVFMLTQPEATATARHKDLLSKTMKALLAEQNPDGGFCESHGVRPRSTRLFLHGAGHALNQLPNLPATIERLRYFVALQKPKHDRVSTHWSRYSRRWNESNLWDSWFRMLTLARLDCALNETAASHWGFIDFPGIGYHHSLRRGD